KKAEARRVLRRALYYRPDDVVLWELAAECAADPKEQEKAQRELVRRFPDDLRHALALGKYLVSQGPQPEARAVLEPLTRKGSAADRAAAPFQLARSYYRKDELKQARAQLDQAAKLDADPADTVQAQLLRGRLLEELKKPAEAARAYQRVLALDARAE